MEKKVLLLSLSDDYWTPFVCDLARDLSDRGVRSVVAVDSRVGEYQCYGRRIDYPSDGTYYLTEFMKMAPVPQTKCIPLCAVFSDYFRLNYHGAFRQVRNIDWEKLGNNLYSFFEYIFERENIGCVVHDQVSTSFSYVCYLACKKYGISFLGLVGARVPDRYEIMQSIYGESKVLKRIYSELINGVVPAEKDEIDWAEAVFHNLDELEPSYMKDRFLTEININYYVNKNKLLSFLNKVKYQFVERDDAKGVLFRELPITNSIRSVTRNIKRWYRRDIVLRLMDNLPEEFFFTSNYYIYPIHSQPEASTSVGSPHFADQVHFITNAAFSMPPGHYLLVKDHISSLAYPDIDFYQKIKLIPNVKLIQPYLNIKKLIRTSKGVITLTSSAGFESLLLDKPVYIFGRTSYDCHPLCRRISSFSELQFALANESYQETYDNKKFLIAYKRYTRPGALDYAKRGWGVASDLSEYIAENVLTSLKGDEHEYL